MVLLTIRRNHTRKVYRVDAHCWCIGNEFLQAVFHLNWQVRSSQLFDFAVGGEPTKRVVRLPLLTVTTCGSRMRCLPRFIHIIMDMENTTRSIDSWVQFLSENEIPVLRQTVRNLAAARDNIEKVNGREISTIVLNDPLMTLQMLAYIRTFHGSRVLKEITTVAHATMMLGVEPFFRHFEKLPVVEEALKPYPQAQLRLLQVIRRAQRASIYAFNWATWRYDMNPEEVTIAALLHDVAEILLLCFAPQQALQIYGLQQADRSLRSAVAQESVLGFRLMDLQRALCRHWQLPELLLALMDDAHAEKARVKTVKLAGDLARHSANGWDDAALPDDYTAIEALLNISHEELLHRLGPHPEISPDLPST
jgi:HD-like signal output (HDOD) protein